MEENMEKSENRQETGRAKAIFDENPDIKDDDKLPVHAPLTLLRYRTLKKNNSLGWWSAIVLVEDHGKKQICFYRWKKRGGEWKRDKKLPIRSYADWQALKEGVESFLAELK
ncbi:MAG: hypothetical protein ABH836_07830 [Candidatus Omnitrophota bacterium]